MARRATSPPESSLILLAPPAQTPHCDRSGVRKRGEEGGGGGRKRVVGRRKGVVEREGGTIIRVQIRAYKFIVKDSSPV